MFKVELLPRKLDACRRDIGHTDLRVRLAVVGDLARGGRDDEQQERIRILLAALGDSHPEVRKKVLVALADLQAHEARDRVLSVLADPEIQVRQMAVLCLGEIAEPNDEEVAGRLASLLRAGDPSIRYQALIAHSQMRPEEASSDLAEALSDEDPEIRELAVRLVDEVLIARGAPLPAKLRAKIEHTAASDDAPGVRLVAQILCGELGFDAPRDLIKMVVGRRFPVREPRDEQTAIQLAGRLGLVETKEDLVRRAFGRLGFSLDPFRWAALGSLCRLGDERALRKLRSGLRSRSPVERTMAVQSLGESGHPDALLLLRPLVSDPGTLDVQVLAEAVARLEAGEARGHLGVAEAPPVLSREA